MGRDLQTLKAEEIPREAKWPLERGSRPVLRLWNVEEAPGAEAVPITSLDRASVE